MLLEDFVSQALVEIVSGVAKASQETKKYGAIINPEGLNNWHNGTFFWSEEDKGSGKKRIGQLIDFEITVFAEQKEGAEGKLGLTVGSILLGASAGGKLDSTNSTANKIKFSVPIIFPES